MDCPFSRKIPNEKKARSTGVTVVLRAHGARVVFRVFTIYLLERAHAAPAKRECALMSTRGKAFFPRVCRFLIGACARSSRKAGVRLDGTHGAKRGVPRVCRLIGACARSYRKAGVRLDERTGQSVFFPRVCRLIGACARSSRKTGVRLNGTHGAKRFFLAFAVFLLERAHAVPEKRECALMGRTGQSGGFLAFAV